MTNLPTKAGDSVYANSNGVQVYTEPNINSDKQRTGDDGGIKSYNKGDLIGTYTGKTINGFYEVDAIIRYKDGAFNWRVKNRGFTVYVLDNQITSTSQQDLIDAKKQKDEEEYKKQLEAALGNGIDGRTTGSGGTSGGNNTFIYLFGGLALLLGGAYLYNNRKKKPSVAVINPPMIKPLKK
jgi:hypothetical protein